MITCIKFVYDDIMISAFLSKQNIDRRVFPAARSRAESKIPEIPIANKDRVYDSKIDGLDGNEISLDKINFLQRLIFFKDCVVLLIKYKNGILP